MTATSPLAHVVTFHHDSNPNRIHRVIVEGASDRDQAVSIFLADCLSIVTVTACEVLDEGQQFRPIPEVLELVEVPQERRAAYIEGAWSEVPAFGQGFATITKYAHRDGYNITGSYGSDAATFATLEEAQAALQAFHEATPILQVIDLRKGSYGYREYLTPGQVEHLAECNGITIEELTERLLAGETFTYSGLFLRPGNLGVREDLKAYRVVRWPKKPTVEPTTPEADPIATRNASLARYRESRNALSAPLTVQATRELVAAAIDRASVPTHAPQAPESIHDEVARLRSTLEKIAKGATMGTEQFRERLGDRKSPTWWAVNVLQDHLACCGGEARRALENAK